MTNIAEIGEEDMEIEPSLIILLKFRQSEEVEQEGREELAHGNNALEIK
ncbi:hypothetical protein [Neobacillus citreus]|nr:hypothetical protein [Neobacillus citreus]